MLLDLAEALLNSLIRHVIEADGGTGHIIKQCFKAWMKQRKPVLLALIAPPGADGLVQRIIACRTAKEFDVTFAEQRGGSFAERHFADRHQGKFLHRLGGALRLRIECFNAFQIIAKEIEPHRIDAPWRKQIENTTAHREIAWLHHRAGALKTIQPKSADKFGHIQALTRRNRFDGATNKGARRHPLQNRVDGCQNKCWLFEGAQHQLAKRSNAL